MKRLPFSILAFLLIFMPVLGGAQEFPPRPVTVMPFMGEEDALTLQQFRDSVSDEIEKLPGNFPPTNQRLPSGMKLSDLTPDEPPALSLVGGRQYVVTGQSFPDDGLHHLQVWLWDVLEPTLVYTDELVCEEVEDAAEFMPLLIEWIFSHVPDPADDSDDDDGDYFVEPEPEPVATVQQPIEEQVEPPRGQRSAAPVFEDEDKWFHLGGRLGGSARIYNAPDNFVDPGGSTHMVSEQSQIGPSFEVALQAAVQLLPFFALQLETLFTMDFVNFPVYQTVSGSVNNYNMQYTTMSLMLPLLAKVTFRPIPFLIAPYGGAYYILPLGPMQIYNSSTDKTGGVEYLRSLAFGISAGITLGMKTSQFRKGAQGMLFVDIRYSTDLGRIEYRDASRNNAMVSSFGRSMVSIGVGYEIGLVNRDVKASMAPRRY